MDIDSYIRGFKEVYEMAKVKCPDLEIEEVVLPKKEEAIIKALSRYLCNDMVNEIIKASRPKTLKIFKEERGSREGIIELSRTEQRVSFVDKSESSNIIRRSGDVIIGVYSKGTPNMYLDNIYQFRLFKTDTVTSLGTFYALPVPLSFANVTYNRLTCKNVNGALYFFEYGMDRHNLCVSGFFPELCCDENHLFELTKDLIIVRRIDESYYTCVGRHEIKRKNERLHEKPFDALISQIISIFCTDRRYKYK